MAARLAQMTGRKHSRQLLRRLSALFLLSHLANGRAQTASCAFPARCRFSISPLLICHACIVLRPGSPLSLLAHDFVRCAAALCVSRYRLLKLVGEGTFSQLIVAEDTFAPSPPSQHHLAGMYGSATISDPNGGAPGVSPGHSPTQAAPGQAPLIPRFRLVALKVMNSKYAFIGVQELDKLFTLNQRDQHGWCPIVRVQGPGAFYFHTHLVLVLELLGPALLSYMKTLPRGRVPVCQLRKIALQLVLALGYVSNAGMIHGDIKPENVLLSSSASSASSRSVKCKLIDYGNAMTMQEAAAYYEDFEVQTLYYRAPEVKRREGERPSQIAPGSSHWSDTLSASSHCFPAAFFVLVLVRFPSR